MTALSFESCAKDVAHTLRESGEAEARRHAQSYQRNLKQVLNDLTLVVEVLSAMGEHGVVMQGFRQQLTSAVSMYDARRRDRRVG